MIDPENYVTREEMTDIAEVIEFLNNLDSKVVDLVALSDANGESLGIIRRSQGVFAYYPGGSRHD